MTRLNILSFDQSVFLQKAKIMYKTLNHLVPGYLSEMFHMQSDILENTNVTLRSVTNEAMFVPRPKIEQFKGSLSYSGAIIWNSIPLDIRNATSINVFTNRCLSWMKTQA